MGHRPAAANFPFMIFSPRPEPCCKQPLYFEQAKDQKQYLDWPTPGYPVADPGGTTPAAAFPHRTPSLPIRDLAACASPGSGSRSVLHRRCPSSSAAPPAILSRPWEPRRFGGCRGRCPPGRLPLRGRFWDRCCAGCVPGPEPGWVTRLSPGHADRGGRGTIAQAFD